MDIDIDKVEEVLASHPQEVINALEGLYRQTRIIVSVNTANQGPIHGELVGVTSDTVSVLGLGTDEVPMVIKRDEIREIGHDFDRVGRPVRM